MWNQTKEKTRMAPIQVLSIVEVLIYATDNAKRMSEKCATDDYANLMPLKASCYRLLPKHLSLVCAPKRPNASFVKNDFGGLCG
jgi:hypothetical protein